MIKVAIFEDGVVLTNDEVFGDAIAKSEPYKDGVAMTNDELEAFAKECFEAGREQQQIIEHSDSGVSYVTGMMEVYPDFSDFWTQRKGRE